MGLSMRGSTARAGAKAKVSGARAVASDLLRARQTYRDEESDGLEIDPAVLASATSVVQAMELYFKSRQIYHEDDPPLQRVRAAFDDKMRAHLASHDSLTVDVSARALEVAGNPVYEVERADHNMCFPLFRDGIRELTFTSGLTIDELVRFVRALVTLAAYTPGDASDEGEDDAVTLLWDLELEHISYVAIDTYASDHDPAPRARVARIEEIVTASITKETPGFADTAVSAGERGLAKQAATVALEQADFAVLERANLAGLDEVPERLRRARGDLMVLGDGDRARLSDVLEDRGLVEKFVEASARAALGARPVTDAELTCVRLEQLFAAIVGDAKFGQALMLRERVAACVGVTYDTPDLLGRIGRAMAAEAPMATVIEALVRRPADDVVEVMDLVRVLPPVASAPLIETLGKLTEPTRRRAVCDLVAAWGSGALEATTAALPASSEELALDLVYIARRIGADRAASLLERATTHAAATVRVAALRLFAGVAAPMALDRRARVAIADVDPAVRAIGLDLIAARRPDGAARWLETAIGGAGFADLDLDEKKRMFFTYALVGGDAAVTALLDRLGERNLLHRSSIDEARIAAACALGQARAEAARPLLAKLAKTTLIRGEVKRACIEALVELDKPTPQRPPSQAIEPVTGTDARPVPIDDERSSGVIVSFKASANPRPSSPAPAPAPSPSAPVAAARPQGSTPIATSPDPARTGRPFRPRPMPEDDLPVRRSPVPRAARPRTRVDRAALGTAVTAIPVIRDEAPAPAREPAESPAPPARPFTGAGYHSMTRKPGGGEKVSVKLPKLERGPDTKPDD